MKMTVPLLLALALPAGADTVNRCEAPGGAVTWANQPCPAGTRTAVVTVRPAVTDSSGLREWAERNPAPRPAKVRATREKEKPYINPVDCENARRSYEFELGWQQRRKESLAFRRREVKRQCGYWP